MSELLRRSITGIGIGIVTLSAILIDQIGFTLFICALGILVNFELYKMVIGEKSNKKAITFSILANLPLFMGFANHYENIQVTFLYFTIAVPIMIIFAFVLHLKQTAIYNGKYLLALSLGIGYVSLSLLSSLQIGWLDGSYSHVLPLSIILLIWGNDIFAYLIGSKFGKNTMAPTLSPKKTWEGTLGGLFCTLILAFVMSKISLSFTVPFWIGLGLCVSIFSTVGDLLESSIKRYAGVKDSGKIFPGHGGAFDRFDSLICVLPVVALYLFLFL